MLVLSGMLKGATSREVGGGGGGEDRLPDSEILGVVGQNAGNSGQQALGKCKRHKKKNMTANLKITPRFKRSPKNRINQHNT